MHSGISNLSILEHKPVRAQRAQEAASSSPVMGDSAPPSYKMNLLMFCSEETF